ncbi:NAD(P)(+)--arginine ADP-ribosyltransferase 2-like [Prinia subflava]|uniref:NAD(P)(+)--arginine ADP-ribosyltransferase 2-like n=1 Tax=Prinia subflava TaxID=208062 RepID=UPI002FE345C7
MAPLSLTLALLAMAVATAGIEVVPLDMAWDSFDDQYQDCGPNMTAALPALNRSEFQKNPLFAWAWPKAVAEWQQLGSPVSPLSSPAQAIALMAYTMNDLYKEFNKAVRVAGRSRQHYRDNFHFKTLHFLLTQAVVALRDTQRLNRGCVYRGVDKVQFQARVGQRVRFGQFASTSRCEDVIHDFGTNTTFEVQTYHGAEIKRFSYFQREDEVLIPPFETFEVTKVDQKETNIRIHLSSTGTFSNYNCEWLKGGSLPRNSPHLGGLLLATVAMAVVTGTL